MKQKKPETNRAKRERRAAQKTPVLIAFAIAVIVLACCFLLILFSLIFGGKKDPATDSATETGTETATERVTDKDRETSRETETVKERQYVSRAYNNEAQRTGTLVLINAEHTYDPNLAKLSEMDFIPVNNARYSLLSNQYKLSTEALAAFKSMMADFVSATGYTGATVTAGFRTLEEQTDGAGQSDLHSGYTVKFNSTTAKNENYAWIVENADRYGFVIRYPDAKSSVTGMDTGVTYILRYVGVAHAAYMKQAGMCLEEYIDLLRGYTVDGQHLSVSAYGNSYEIYFVPAKESEEVVTTVNIPADAGDNYVVSGTNAGGFVVTVKK